MIPEISLTDTGQVYKFDNCLIFQKFYTNYEANEEFALKGPL
jgi:hypothetical protein